MHFRYFSSEQTFRRAVCNECARRSPSAPGQTHLPGAYTKPRLFRYNYAECHTGISPEWFRKKPSSPSISFPFARARDIYARACVLNALVRIGDFVGQRVVDTSDKKIGKKCLLFRTPTPGALNDAQQCGNTRWKPALIEFKSRVE